LLGKLSRLIPSYENQRLSHGKLVTVQRWFDQLVELEEDFFDDRMESNLYGWSRTLRDRCFVILQGHGIDPYQGVNDTEPPRGTRRAKAAWLREHLEAGAVTLCAVAAALEIRPDDVEAIAAGRTELGNNSWARIAALIEPDP
jgi:hypothetical protein